MTDNAPATNNNSKAAIRHVEKRRISTCEFADRIAESVLKVYRSSVNPKPHPTCLAAVVVHEGASDQLSVIALGVGTKFLTEGVIRNEQANEIPYGRRVRDMHGEVLCRRAFRKYLSQRIFQDIQQAEEDPLHQLSSVDFLERTEHHKWKLRQGCTLHAYFSSTPCGNATVKKFAKMTKERFRPELTLWPTERHSPEIGHSIHLGQFTLLVKKDATAAIEDAEHVTIDTKQWRKYIVPVENIPTGTAPVYSKQGSLHTCSDKVCRWNCLGWQGSLLRTLFEEPLHMKTITVGRKYSNICFRRAVCCRIGTDSPGNPQGHRVNHPSVMCTAVYVDPDAVVVPQQDGANDVTFTSTQAFVWWPGLTQAQTLDSHTGFSADAIELESPVCSKQLTEAFRTIQVALGVMDPKDADNPCRTLGDLRRLKLSISPQYEAEKDKLFRHKVMRHWCRRYSAEVQP
eukprot:scaffold3988_cov162-Amphora_coffeaeformis.AAC.1